MLNQRQQQIIALLNDKTFLPTAELLKELKLSRARLNQLIHPLIKKGLVRKEGRARATVYRVTGKKNIDDLSRENWHLRSRVRELEKSLNDRKIIERAKEILIAQFDILPTEAYRKLQQQSMDRGRSMREISEAILSAYGG